MLTATPILDAVNARFHTAHVSMGHTEAEPRYMIIRHEGFTQPFTVGFVFRRKSGRWGAAVMPPLGHGALAADIPRFSVATMEEAVAAVVIDYDATARASG